MGRGDKRTRKGKIFKGSFGNSRPQKVEKTAVVAVESVKKATKPKATKAATAEGAEKKTAKRAPAKKAAAKKDAE